MREDLQPVPVSAFIGRDRLALIGVVCWVLSFGLYAFILLSGHLVDLGDLLEGSFLGVSQALLGAFAVPSVPFLIGAAFLIPRLRFLGRTQGVGRALPAVIVERDDVAGGSGGGSRIVYGYEYQGRQHRVELRTAGVLPGLAVGEGVTVLVDPERPERSWLPAAYQ